VKPDTFYFPITKIRSPYSNLAIEEAIALNLAKENLIGGIRLWKNPPTIVLGLSENPNLTIEPKVIQNFQSNMEFGLRKKYPNDQAIYIARRASGGGTVYQDPIGNINYSIYVNLNKQKDLFSVKESYQILLGLVIKALNKQLVDASSNGKSDITISDAGVLKKISGNAQFRKKNCIVQHGTLILQDSLIDRVTGLLLHPPEEPEYRKARKHRDFLTALPNHFDVDAFGDALFQEFRTYLQLEKSKAKENFSFFSKGFSSFRRSVLKESEIIRKNKYESLSYILNREIPT
jgi:lipoate-protein ligase A